MRFLRRQIDRIRIVEKAFVVIEFRREKHAEDFAREHEILLREGSREYRLGAVQDLERECRSVRIKSRVWIQLPSRYEGMLLVLSRTDEAVELPVQFLG